MEPDQGCMRCGGWFSWLKTAEQQKPCVPAHSHDEGSNYFSANLGCETSGKLFL